jgi:hypothetical protein
MIWLPGGGSASRPGCAAGFSLVGVVTGGSGRREGRRGASDGAPEASRPGRFRFGAVSPGSLRTTIPVEIASAIPTPRRGLKDDLGINLSLPISGGLDSPDQFR